ncbi:polysaccharide deacetylase family protein [Roseomonas alkaliterrae]|uniref:Chitooligosaccharide deacetylase n=1 Tax=Neoroseomonas alkaliterrae TaxID=1452450 RepID=A0A840XMN9_9PROT|nr:polysaccharide deacetylase family protein [Neoroseomonas alkaliterrae]MBB5688000.1 peptidoglycan/xylan/chitin deacetylase (PgdA/CDA1 family) [Neoroseomonas alkaliterrae]MBR0678322.1 polysaccharide deacetylase family protein [Neoroseomonas alkaliterrae]
MLKTPGHYAFMPWRRRPRITWPGGARIAFWVVPNIEHYEYDPPPNARRMPWPRPLPDIAGYSWRDYGNRVGFWRMAEVMARHGVRGSVSLNVAVCDHYPEIIERCCELGWELFSHGTYNTRYFYGMSEDQQRAVIRENREAILRASGQSMDGWLTPAISNDETTQHILAEEGILYTLDLLHDDQPTPLVTRSGQRLVSIPYSLEVNDVPLFVMRNTPPARYAAICKAQFDTLYEEGAESGTVMCLPIHPYLVGQPHRVAALEEVLRHVTGHDKVWLATGREIAKHYIAHHLAAHEAWIAEGTP